MSKTEGPCCDPLLVKPCDTVVPLQHAPETAPKTVLEGVALLKFWLVLVFTLLFCLLLLVCAHVTHSLTLRVEAYHSLYNLTTLIGCLITMQACQREDNLKNTFGWARLEILSSLCTLLFLGSLCFGVAMDCIQTAFHAEHQDAMHHPTKVIALGAIGLCLNTVVFFLVGGKYRKLEGRYTHHQGCFLERRPSGVWIKSNASAENINAGERVATAGPLHSATDHFVSPSHQGAVGTLRDISGLVLVMICASIVLWDNGGMIALYVDPGFAVLSAGVLIFLSYPYGRECGQILIQTIPAHIDVESFSERLLKQFPEIVNIHHLHIWSFTPAKVIATAHVVFANPLVYRAISEDLDKFFKEEEITKVTLQPEFLNMVTTPATSEYGSCACLLPCEAEQCNTKTCCLDDRDTNKDTCRDRRTNVHMETELHLHCRQPAKIHQSNEKVSSFTIASQNV